MTIFLFLPRLLCVLKLGLLFDERRGLTSSGRHTHTHARTHAHTPSHESTSLLSLHCILMFSISYDTDLIENTASNCYIVGCVFFAAGTCLPSRCLALSGGIKDTQATRRFHMPHFIFENKGSRLRMNFEKHIMFICIGLSWIGSVFVLMDLVFVSAR
jgi:hypothetical protein